MDSKGKEDDWTHLLLVPESRPLVERQRGGGAVGRGRVGALLLYLPPQLPQVRQVNHLARSIDQPITPLLGHAGGEGGTKEAEEEAAAEEGQPRNIVELVVRRRKKTVYEAKAGRLRASNKYLQAGGTI